MKRDLSCRGCGDIFGRTPGAGLFCDADCEAEHIEQLKSICGQLVEAGFIQSEEAPNMWSKDNVSITIEEVKHVGLDEAIRRHGAVVQELSNSQ
jgi:hypothetical protein